MKLFGRKKTDIEFRGVSASRDKRNAIFLFVVEALVVLLFIGGVVAVLNYVGIISLSGINSAIFSSLPVQEQTNEKLEVVSDIPGYSLKLENEDQLLEILESWGVYGKEYGVTYGATGSTQGVPLEKIVIHLVGTHQKTNSFGTGQTEESIYSSSLTTISPGRFDINIYIDSSIIDGQNENLIPDLVFRTTFFSSIYRIVNPIKIGDDGVDERQKFYTDYQNSEKMQMNYFDISKR